MTDRDDELMDGSGGHYDRDYEPTAEQRFNWLRGRFQGFANTLRVPTPDIEPLTETEVADIIDQILVEEAELHG